MELQPDDLPSSVAVRLRFDALKNMIGRADANGWSFCYNMPCSQIPSYGFSAKMQPHGRGSTVEDWEYLGTVMAAIGVPFPDGPSRFLFFTDVSTADPNSVLKWLWADKTQQKGCEAKGQQSTPMPGGVLSVLHTDPASVDKSELAMLIGLMDSAAGLARSLPGLKLPVHVMIEINGHKLCGQIQDPADKTKTSGA